MALSTEAHGSHMPLDPWFGFGALKLYSFDTLSTRGTSPRASQKSLTNETLCVNDFVSATFLRRHDTRPPPPTHRHHEPSYISQLPHIVAACCLTAHSHRAYQMKPPSHTP